MKSPTGRSSCSALPTTCLAPVFWCSTVGASRIIGILVPCSLYRYIVVSSTLNLLPTAIGDSSGLCKMIFKSPKGASWKFRRCSGGVLTLRIVGVALPSCLPYMPGCRSHIERKHAARKSVKEAVGVREKRDALNHWTARWRVLIHQNMGGSCFWGPYMKDPFVWGPDLLPEFWKLLTCSSLLVLRGGSKAVCRSYDAQCARTSTLTAKVRKSCFFF